MICPGDACGRVFHCSHIEWLETNPSRLGGSSVPKRVHRGNDFVDGTPRGGLGDNPGRTSRALRVAPMSSTEADCTGTGRRTSSANPHAHAHADIPHVTYRRRHRCNAALLRRGPLALVSGVPPRALLARRCPGRRGRRPLALRWRPALLESRRRVAARRWHPLGRRWPQRRRLQRC